MSIVLDGTLGITSVTGSAATAVAGPAFSAYLPTTNQSISSSTWTKVALSAEEFDTNNNFDSTTNYRFTPTVAGYYQISACSNIDANTTSATSVYLAIYKNGSIYKYTRITLVGGNNVNGGSTVSTIVSLNGSTDFIEFYAQSVGGTAPILTFGSTATYMSGSLVRGS